MCDRFPRKFDVQTSYKPSDYVLKIIFVVNIKFPRATYHTIVPSTEELYCLIIIQHIVTLSKYGQSALNIRHLYTTDILRYTLFHWQKNDRTL